MPKAMEWWRSHSAWATIPIRILRAIAFQPCATSCTAASRLNQDSGVGNEPVSENGSRQALYDSGVTHTNSLPTWQAAMKHDGVSELQASIAADKAAIFNTKTQLS